MFHKDVNNLEAGGGAENSYNNNNTSSLLQTTSKVGKYLRVDWNVYLKDAQFRLIPANFEKELEKAAKVSLVFDQTKIIAMPHVTKRPLGDGESGFFKADGRKKRKRNMRSSDPSLTRHHPPSDSQGDTPDMPTGAAARCDDPPNKYMKFAMLKMVSEAKEYNRPLVLFVGSDCRYSV